jgi:large subunit ribosomal protein L31
MKDKIHPKYFPDAKVVCACGNTWTVGSTKAEIHTEVCNKCHPFFTGQQQRLVDTEGRVDAFARRIKTSDSMRSDAVVRDEARAKRAKARRLVEIVDEDETVKPIAAEEILGGEATDEKK